MERDSAVASAATKNETNLKKKDQRNAAFFLWQRWPAGRARTIGTQAGTEDQQNLHCQWHCSFIGSASSNHAGWNLPVQAHPGPGRAGPGRGFGHGVTAA
jgi:hypothetical protein